MSKVVFVTLLCVIVAFSSPSNFSQYYNVTFPQNAQLFQYSPDHRFLGISNGSQFHIFNAKTGKFIQNLTNDQDQIISFAFSQNGQYLAIGLENSDVKMYQYDNSTFQEVNNFTFNQTTNKVQSLCFASDNSVLIIGLQKNILSMWDFSDTNNSTNIINETSYEIKAISCSLTSPNYFVVVLENTTESNFILSLIWQHTTDFQIVQNVDLDQNFIDADICYGKNHIYVINKVGDIAYCNITDNCTQIQNISQTDTSGLDLKKIRVSADQSFIVVVNQNSANNTNNTVFLFSSSAADNYNSFQVQTFPSTVSSFAFSQHGGILFTSATGNQGNSYAACETNQYLDDSGQCKQCKSGCEYCFASANDCSGCFPDFHQFNNTCICSNGSYTEDNITCEQCSNAIPGCTQCTNNSTCQSCNETNNWQLNNTTKQCDCKTHFYKQLNQCNQCSVGCNKCINDSNCEVCDTANHWQLNDTNQCNCEIRYFDDNNNCTSCNTGCDLCDNNQTCINCSQSDHWILDNDTICICDESGHWILENKTCTCNQSFYQQHSQCKSCTTLSHCINCFTNGSCFSCQQTYTIINGQCGCTPKQYDQNSSCHDCPKQCAQCTSETHCFVCEKDYSLNNGKCEKGGLSIVAIVFIVIGALLLMGIVIFIIVKFVKKKPAPLPQEHYQQM